MDPERLQRAREIFEHAIDLDSISRAAYLEEACAADQALRIEVEAMIVSQRDTLARFRPVSEPLRSDQIGPYQILQKLGDGGMGAVYLAQFNGKQIAIKVLKRGMDTDEILRRFKQEQKILAALDHPNIARLIEAGVTDADLPYFVMEYISGKPIDQYCRLKKLDTAETLSLFRFVCSAVQYAHQQGVIHRDLKPANILMTSDGVPKLLDFGIAKLLDPAQPGLTTTSFHAMTPDYASPEQSSGEAATFRSDIYSLGMILHELLTGQRLRHGDDMKQRGEAIKGDLNHIISMALQKEPAFRYSSAEAFSDDIQRSLEGLPVAARASMRRYRLQKTFRKPANLFIGFFLLLVLAASISLFTLNKSKTAEQHSRVIKSIAVLPFQPISGAKRDVYLEQGIADALITRLSGLKGIIVRPTTAVQQYSDAPHDPVDIGRKLRVDAVLSGNIQESENQLRVIARLTATANGEILWSQQYDSPSGAIFALQDLICSEAAQKLTSVNGKQQQRLKRRETTSVAAYQAYLRGRYFWNRRTEEGYKQSLGYFNQATKEDLNFALAYVGLADAYQFLGDATLPRKQAMEIAEANLRKALQIDPDLPEAHASFGLLTANYKWEWSVAMQEYRKAIALEPNFSRAHHWYGEFLVLMGRSDEGIQELKRALEIDPFSLIINTDLGKCLMMARRYDEAIVQLKKTLELDPGYLVAHEFLCETYVHKGMYKEAIAQFKGTENSLEALIAIGYAYGLAGNRVEAEKRIAILKEVVKHRHVSPAYLVPPLIALGKRDEVFQYLELAFSERSSALIGLKTAPIWDPIRSDPRFVNLMSRMGLLKPLPQ